MALLLILLFRELQLASRMENPWVHKFRKKKKKKKEEEKKKNTTKNHSVHLSIYSKGLRHPSLPVEGFWVWCSVQGGRKLTDIPK